LHASCPGQHNYPDEKREDLFPPHPEGDEDAADEGGGIGLGAAVDYLERVGMDAVRRHEEELTSRLIRGLKEFDRVGVYASGRPESRNGMVSFTIDGLHPHEIAQYLDENADIMVRSSHHCCMPEPPRPRGRDGAGQPRHLQYAAGGRPVRGEHRGDLSEDPGVGSDHVSTNSRMSVCTGIPG